MLESKHPPPVLGDHSIEGTKFVSVWNESRAASVGDMNEERDGENVDGDA